MNDIEDAQPLRARLTGLFATGVNVIASPADAFTEIRQRPRKLFPMAVILLSVMGVTLWYFMIVDIDWYIDDLLSGADLGEQSLEEAREDMQALLPPAVFMVSGVVGSVFGLLMIWLLQAGYLSLVSAVRGDQLRFGHWFSLTLWTSLPYLLSVIGMVVNILLTPNGQLSSYDLDPLTLRNLGMSTDNTSLQQIFNTVSLSILWSIALLVYAWRQWLQSSWGGALAVVCAPWLLIFAAWTYFALA